MQANIARARAGGAEILEVTKEATNATGSYKREITVPELIGKQNVIAKCVKATNEGVRNFVCIPDAGGTFAFGYGQISSYANGYQSLNATYDPDTGKFTTDSSGFFASWAGTYKFYAW